MSQDDLATAVFWGRVVFGITLFSLRARYLNRDSMAHSHLNAIADEAPPTMRHPTTYSASLPSTRMDVTAITLALDWRARPLIQSKLQALAESGDTRSSAGLASLLHETVAVLRQYERAWLYAGAVSTPPISPDASRQLFTQAVDNMRTRYRRELLRNADGTSIETPAPRMRAREA